MQHSDAVIASILAGCAGYLLGRQEHPKPSKGRIKFSGVSIGGNLIKGEIMSFVLRADQRVTVAIQPVDRFGNPAKVDGIPVWTDATDQTVLTPGADGMICLIEPKGPLGTTQINVTADADLGDGVVQIMGVLDLEVVAGQAVSVTINPGVPEDMP